MSATDTPLPIEKHLQTILATLITAAILWGSAKLTDYQAQLARFEERLAALTEKIDTTAIMRGDVEDLKTRVRVLESKLGEK